MQPTKELLRTLTPTQRQAIEELQKKEYVKTLDTRRTKLFIALTVIGAAQFRPETNLPNEFIIEKGWETVDVSIQPRGARGPYGVVTKDVSCLVENEPIPDPPKPKIVRPPAVYSNRSADELIDHVLKNY